MYIEDSDSGSAKAQLSLRLTVAEVPELRDSLVALLDDPRPQRHEHISSADTRVR